MTNLKPAGLSGLLCAVSVCALSSQALAQSNPAPAPSAAAQAAAADTGEIIVTAQKREQRLSDVPVTVLAASGDQLQTAGVTDVAQIGKVAPSFTVASSVYGYQVFSIRGVNFNTQQASAPPAVSVYTDEAPLPYTIMTGGLLLDVERVEVLKGPQGTLFGQNATAGSINVIAAKPTATAQYGFRVDVNHFGEVMGEGYASGPISETLLARVAASTTQGGAWQKGYHLFHGKNGDQNKAAGRLLLDWTPTERFRAQLNVNGNFDKGEVIQSQLALVDPVVPPLAQPGLIGYPIATKNRHVEIDPGFDTKADRHMIQAVLRMDYDVGDSAQLTSLTNYAKFKSDHPVNYDAIALDNAYAFVFSDIETFSQEVRLAGSVMDGNVDYVLGANYSKDEITEGQHSVLNNYSPLPFNTQYRIDYDVTAEAKAIFGNLDYKITPELTVSAGARYTWTKQTIAGCISGNEIWNGLLMRGISTAFRAQAGLGAPPAELFAPGACSTINDNKPNVQNPNGPGLIPDFLPEFTRDTQKQNNFSWRGSVSYKPTPDSMLYVTVSRGYKAGVFPVQPNLLASEAEPVKQEELTSYEAGAKLALFDRKLRLNASAFHYDYRDKQFYTYFPIAIGGVSSFIINVDKSEVNGFDADFTFNPSRQLTLRGAVTYIDTKVKKISKQVFSGQGVPYDPVGKNFNYAPPWSATFDAEYRVPVGGTMDAFVGAAGQYYSKSYSDLGEDDTLSNPKYFTLDLRVGVQSSTGWRASVWVRNVTDKDYWTTIFRAGDMLSKYGGLPRTWGVSAAFNF